MRRSSPALTVSVSWASLGLLTVNPWPARRCSSVSPEAKPTVTSGIRVGTPAVTTRGMAEAEMVKIADLITRAVENSTDEAVLAAVRRDVFALTRAFPLPQVIA